MRRWVLRGLILILVLAASGGGFVWFKLSGGFVPRTSVADLSKKLSPAFRIDKPDPAVFGPGPYPAVLLYHGCGGLTRKGKRRPVTDIYARLANDLGAVAITVDSFSPRGITEAEAQARVCSGWILRGAERAADIIASLTAARSMDFVDPDRLALAGWSHGSWTVMDMLTFDGTSDRPHGLADPAPDALAGVRFIFLAYPHCGFPARTARNGWVYDIAAIAVLGENDTLTPAEDCLTAFDRVRADGGHVDVQIMPNATHAFDEADLVDHAAFRYDPDAAAKSHALYQTAIGNYLKTR